jgi:hypothetical protein
MTLLANLAPVVAEGQALVDWAYATWVKNPNATITTAKADFDQACVAFLQWEGAPQANFVTLAQALQGSLDSLIMLLPIPAWIADMLPMAFATVIAMIPTGTPAPAPAVAK